MLAHEKAIAVLAGPGSGKTRTLSYRARHLLLDQPKSRALLLTFTNKAAAEMKTRAIGVSLVASSRLDASTFHTFGATLLRSHGGLIGVQSDFDIMDDDEAALFAAEVSTTARVSNYRQAWGRARRRRLPPSPRIAAFAEAYEEAKRAATVVDFDDLVVYPAMLLEENESMAAAYGARYQHLLVDEFQDTNAAQFSIVKALSPHVATVSVFADDDQAIFGFADAEARNIRQFADDLGATEYPLTCNYRSREAIVQKANLLIAAEPTASGRRMRAHKDGGEVVLRVYESLADEATALGGAISRAVYERGVPPASIAILTRNGFRVDSVVDQLRRRGIPLSDWRGVAYEPRERRALITCMAAIRPRLSDRQARKLSELMQVALIDEREAHRFLEAHGEHPVAAELLRAREQAFSGGSPHEVVAAAGAAASIADPSLSPGMQALVDAVAEFERFDPDYTLEHLLADLALKTGGRPPTEGGGVKVATLHSAKGLEWPIVYLVGLEEGKLPDFRNLDTPEEVAEERRACFVGVCRAEDTLIVTAISRFRTVRQRPSRFLREMALI